MKRSDMNRSERDRHVRLVKYLSQYDDFESRVDAAMEGIRPEAEGKGVSPEKVTEYHRFLVSEIIRYRGQ